MTEEPLLVEVVEEPIHPDSPEGFKIERPWLLPDISVIENPDYNAEDVFSSKYLLHDVTDIEISQ